MLQAILFDIDGTLVDSNDFHILAWAEAFKQAGHEFRLAEIHEQIGKGGDNLLPALLPNIDEKQMERLKSAHRDLFKQHYFRRLKPFPGARELLERCRDVGYAVVLASSASGEELDHHLDDVLGARDLVDAWTSADDVGCSKPCPDIFVTALTKAKVAPDEALVIGDTPYDIEAAGEAGVQTLAVRSGGFRDDQLSGAIAIFDDVAELLERFDASPLSRVEAQV
jgi:membrane protein